MLNRANVSSLYYERNYLTSVYLCLREDIGPATLFTPLQKLLLVFVSIRERKDTKQNHNVCSLNGQLTFN